MIKYYSLGNDTACRSVIEFEMHHHLNNEKIELLLEPDSTEKFPNDVSFYVSQGKRWTDIINYHKGGLLHLYSQKLVDVLNQFVDMSNYCYPIKINNSTQSYYVLYNLPRLKYINRYQQDYLFSQLWKDTICFSLPTQVPLLFNLENTLIVACVEDVKNAIQKAKLTNIYFYELYGLSHDECDI